MRLAEVAGNAAVDWWCLDPGEGGDQVEKVASALDEAGVAEVVRLAGLLTFHRCHACTAFDVGQNILSALKGDA